MSNPDTMPDEEFLRRFLACRLEPADFDHRGHLRAACLILGHHTLDEAVELTCTGISRLAVRFGAPGKYNRTMSEALVRMMAHDGAGRGDSTLDDFLHANPQYATDVAGLLARHYSDERLNCDEAHARFLPPDREPLQP